MGDSFMMLPGGRPCAQERQLPKLSPGRDSERTLQCCKGVLINFFSISPVTSATGCPLIEANGNKPQHNPKESIALRDSVTGSRLSAVCCCDLTRGVRADVHGHWEAIENLGPSARITSLEFYDHYGSLVIRSSPFCR